MAYKELCETASKKGVHVERIPFRGIENDPQVSASRQTLISKLDALHANRVSMYALIVAVTALLITAYDHISPLIKTFL